MMVRHKVDFNLLNWESLMPGFRFKAYQHAGRQLRLVEYTQEMEPHWCEKGHFGYVLEGQFEIRFDNEVVVFNPGNGIFIPSGKAHRHKGKALTDVVKIIFVEDI